MKPVYQSNFSAEDGDCRAACIASLLEVGLDEIPNIRKSGWLAELNKFLFKKFDVSLLYCEYSIGLFLPLHIPFIASVKRGDFGTHSVIMQADEHGALMLLHNPNPTEEKKGEVPLYVAFIVRP